MSRFCCLQKVANIHDRPSQCSTDKGKAVSSIDVEEEVDVRVYLKTKPEEEHIDKRIDHFDRASVLKSRLDTKRLLIDSNG